jgi:hypothetical protein
MELLVDLRLTEEIDLDSCLVGYCFSPSSNDKNRPVGDREANARKLMDSMGKEKRSMLDYINIPVKLDESGAIAPSVLQERKLLQDALGGVKVVKVGLDLTTAVLSSVREEEFEQLQDSLERVKVPCLTVATNVLTAEKSRRIIKRLRSRVEIIVATEVLRTDFQRPSLLVPFATDVLSPSHAKAQEGIKAATADLKHAVDRCLTLEKHFIEKLKPELPDVVVTDLCWAHVLMQTQNTIQSPEEWHYFLERQVMPKLDACIEYLKRSNKPAADWATLYAGMARYMFSTFSLFQARRRELCLHEVLDVINSGNTFAVTTIDALPGHLGILASAFGSCSTVLSGCEVRQNAPGSLRVDASEAERVLMRVVGPVALKHF